MFRQGAGTSAASRTSSSVRSGTSCLTPTESGQGRRASTPRWGSQVREELRHHLGIREERQPSASRHLPGPGESRRDSLASCWERNGAAPPPPARSARVAHHHLTIATRAVFVPSGVVSRAKYTPEATRCPRSSRPSQESSCGPAPSGSLLSRRTRRPERSQMSVRACAARSRLNRSRAAPRLGLGTTTNSAWKPTVGFTETGVVPHWRGRMYNPAASQK